MPTIRASSCRVLLAILAMTGLLMPSASAGLPDSAPGRAPRTCPRDDGTLLFSGRVAVKGTYLDEPLLFVTSPKTSPVKRYYHTDHLYSIYALTDAAGTVVERYRYEAYGKATVLTAAFAPKANPNYSQYANPWTFTGQRLDAETSLHYYKNRFYSAGLGRFVGRDPIGYEGGWNLYEYVDSSTTNWLDPFGLKLKVAKSQEVDLKSANKYVQDALDVLCPGKFKVGEDGVVSPLNENFCKKLPEDESACGTDRYCGLTEYPQSCCCICDLINNEHEIVVTYLKAGSTWPNTVGEEWAKEGHKAFKDRDYSKKPSVRQKSGLPGAGESAQTVLPVPNGGFKYEYNIDGKWVLVKDWQIFAYELCGNGRMFSQGLVPIPEKPTEGAKAGIKGEKEYSIPSTQRIEKEHGAPQMPDDAHTTGARGEIHFQPGDLPDDK